jgi:nucleoside-diphosphate-sugar epimerase
MTFGLGHVGAIDENTPSKTADPIEHYPKLKFEEKVLSCTKIRTVVVRPGFVYGRVRFNLDNDPN